MIESIQNTRNVQNPPSGGFKGHIKVCGITTVEQMQQLHLMEVDYAGMIFYEGSKRFAVENLKNQKTGIRNLKIKKVGVFVNADLDTILAAIDDYDLTAIQLHGDETPDFCKELMKRIKVIKAFRITGYDNIEELIKPFQSTCHYFLFDTSPKPSLKGEVTYGGTGEKFDWNILQKHKINKPFFLSGGIELADVSRLKLFNHLNFKAVDVNSRFEIEPGVKDLNKVEQFVKQLKDG